MIIHIATFQICDTYIDMLSWQISITMLHKYHSDVDNIMKYTVSNRAVDFRGVDVVADSFFLTAG